jgi:hypothetical protein
VTRLRHRFALLALIAVYGQVAGCGSSPAVKYYALNPQVTAGPAATNLAIKVGPAQFPASLDRNQIVTRLSDTQVAVNQYNVWSAPLREQFLRVLGDNLGNALGTDRVVVYPNDAGYSLDYQLLLDVLQFDGKIGGDVTLRVRWTLAAPDGSALESGLFFDSQAAGDAGYDGLVAAHNLLVASLARSLASHLENLSPAARPG